MGRRKFFYFDISIGTKKNILFYFILFYFIREFFHFASILRDIIVEENSFILLGNYFIFIWFYAFWFAIQTMGLKTIKELPI